MTHFLVTPICDDKEWQKFASRHLGVVNPAHVEGLTLATGGIPGVIRPFLEALTKGVT